MLQKHNSISEFWMVSESFSSHWIIRSEMFRLFSIQFSILYFVQHKINNIICCMHRKCSKPDNNNNHLSGSVCWTWDKLWLGNSEIPNSVMNEMIKLLEFNEFQNHKKQTADFWRWKIISLIIYTNHVENERGAADAWPQEIRFSWTVFGFSLACILRMANDITKFKRTIRSSVLVHIKQEISF